MKGKTIIFLIAFLFAAFFRFYRLSTLPPSLFSDEVDAGYQAFVFNRCGTDYFGTKSPTHFHSFADWRTPFLIYSIAFTQKIIGNNDLAIRLPPAIFGLLACIIFFLLLQKIFKNFYLSLAGFLVFSFNPWFFHYSRAAWEVSGMIFVLLLGIYFWLVFLESHRLRHLLFSLLFFCSTFYFYATAKLFVIFIFLALFLVWRRQIIALPKKHLILAFVFVFLFSLPMTIDILKGTAGFRFSYINLLTDPELPSGVISYRFQDNAVSSKENYGRALSLSSKIFHNKFSHLFTTFTRNYFSSFSLDYLFLSGDSQLRQGFQQRGNFYLFEIIFIILGLLSIKKNQPLFFVFLLLLFSPISFSLTRDSPSPQSTRLIFMAPLLVIFIVSGLKSLHPRPLLTTLIFITYFIGFIDFYHFYTVHYPHLSAKDWHYGLKAAVEKSAGDSSWSKIYYSDSYEPFIPFFFYHRRYLPPDGSCASALALRDQKEDFFTGRQLENRYFFGRLNWSRLLAKKEDLSRFLFVIPGDEYDRLKSTIDHQYQIKIIHQSETEYQSQIPIYLLTFI